MADNVSCNNPIIGTILGCTEGVSGCAPSEHNPRCCYCGGHSPQRNKMSQQYTACRMLNGQMILETGYKAIVCEQLLEIDASISDQDFVPLWNQFVSETQALADALPDYDKEHVSTNFAALARP